MPQQPNEKRLFSFSQSINGLTYSIYVSGPTAFPLPTMPAAGHFTEQFLSLIETHASFVHEKVQTVQSERRNAAAAKADEDRRRKNEEATARAKDRNAAAVQP